MAMIPGNARTKIGRVHNPRSRWENEVDVLVSQYKYNAQIEGRALRPILTEVGEIRLGLQNQLINSNSQPAKGKDREDGTLDHFTKTSDILSVCLFNIYSLI